MECLVDGGDAVGHGALPGAGSAVELPEPGEVAFDLGGVRRPRAAGGRPAAGWRWRSSTRPRCPRGSTARRRCGTACSPPTCSRARTAGASPRRWWRRAASRSTPGPCSPRDADDAVLGAAIMLPDHPQLAPESRGGLFDSTEIEEALLLHVMALSDAEREQAHRPRRAGDDRARRPHHARGADGAARPRHDARPRAGRARGDGRRRHLPARATPSCCGRARAATRRTTWCRAGARRSSASTSTSTAACSSRSPSTTCPARTSCATSGATCSSVPTRWRCS